MLTSVEFLLGAVLLAQTPVSPTYEAARAAATARCDAIDRTAYQTGLAFNPDGYRSYYVRSECLQKAAIAFRDVALCDRVRQRRALLSSSWGYSPGNCHTLVRQAMEADRVELLELRRRHLAGAMVLRGVRVERNGNGRDFDVIPLFEGREGHGYTLTLEIVTPGSRPVTIHRNGYYVDPRSALRIFLRQQDIRAGMPSFEPGRVYLVRAIAAYALPAGSDSRFMSDAFIESVFPASERTHTVTREVAFPLP
jgi:hypothetical protein